MIGSNGSNQMAPLVFSIFPKSQPKLEKTKIIKDPYNPWNSLEASVQHGPAVTLLVLNVVTAKEVGRTPVGAAVDLDAVKAKRMPPVSVHGRIHRLFVQRFAISRNVVNVLSKMQKIGCRSHAKGSTYHTAASIIRTLHCLT